jgi:hypothetical protein
VSLRHRNPIPREDESHHRTDPRKPIRFRHPIWCHDRRIVMRAVRRFLQGAFLGVFLMAAGSSYLGSARSFDPRTLDPEPGWLAVRTVPLILQEGAEDCGLAALTMVLAYWDHPVCRDQVLRASPANPGAGIRAGDLREFAKTCGVRAYLIHGDTERPRSRHPWRARCTSRP